MVGTQPAHQHTHHECRQIRIGHRALREDLAEIAVHVGHAEARRNVGQIVHPVDAPGALHLLPGIVGAPAGGESIGRVVNDEVELRPVLRGLADVFDVGIAQQIRKRALGMRRKQALVHAHVLDAGLERLLVVRVDDLLVVHAPWPFGHRLVGVVADGVALDGIGLQLSQFLLVCFKCAGLAGREDQMRHRAFAAAGHLIDLLARLQLLLVGEEPVDRLM